MTYWILVVIASSAYGYKTVAFIDHLPSYEECSRVAKQIPELLVRPEFKCIEVRK